MHPREIAAKSGEKTYTGKACKRCGQTTRHTTNASCVKCSNERARVAMNARRKAIKEMMELAQSGVSQCNV